MANPTTVADLVTVIESARQRLDENLATLSDDQMNAPLLEGNWSVKDVMAHLAFWEQRLLYGLRNESENPYPAPPPEVANITSEPWVEGVNEYVFAKNHDRPLAEVRGEYERSYRETVEFIRSLSEHDVFDPKGLAQRAKRNVLEFIAGNTYEHYDEHSEVIERAFPTSA